MEENTEINSGQEPEENLTAGIEIEAGQETTVENGDQEAGSVETKTISQEVFNEAMKKKQTKYQKEVSKSFELEQKLKDANEKLDSYKPKTVEIPAIPDSYDDDYESKMAERDRAISMKAQADFEVENNRIAHQQQQAQTEQDRQAQAQKSMASYSEKAIAMKLDQEEMIGHENTIVMHIQNPDVTNFMLDNAKGPLLVRHLGNNIDELEKIASMTAMDAAIYMTTEIIPKLKITDKNLPPGPLDIPKGGAPPDGVDPIQDGITYE